MVDIVDKATRSRMMAGIKGKNTKPELALRRALHARGFRYRLHAKDIIGKPDLVLPKYRAIVFVHGCFWHRHNECRYATTPTTHKEFWETKFSSNVARDVAVQDILLQSGWRIAIIWECALRNPAQIDAVTEFLTAWFNSKRVIVELGEQDLE